MFLQGKIYALSLLLPECRVTSQCPVRGHHCSYSNSNTTRRRSRLTGKWKMRHAIYTWFPHLQRGKIEAAIRLPPTSGGQKYSCNLGFFVFFIRTLHTSGDHNHKAGYCCLVLLFLCFIYTKLFHTPFPPPGLFK